MRNLLRRIWYLATGRRHELDLADELAFHREMKAQALRDRGIGEAEIAAATQQAMGNDLTARQQARDVWVWSWLQDISQDVRFGVRMLARDRRFTAAAVLALGLGIGVNNSVFTVIDAVVWKDLPFEQPDRLVKIRALNARGQDGGLRYADIQRWRETLVPLLDVGLTSGGTMIVSDTERSPERLRGTYISHESFRLLRAHAQLGRVFLPEDDRPGAPAVAVLSHPTWLKHYGGDPAVVGRSVRINRTAATIVGVMPKGFGFPSTPEIWQPLSQHPLLTGQTTISVFGRLTEAGEVPALQAQLETLFAAAAKDDPTAHKDTRIDASRLREGNIRDAGALLLTVMGAVAFVLLIACANVASLLLARATHRSREIAIRASLGATRWRIVRQLLIECLLLAIAAGALGYAISSYGADTIGAAFDTREVASPQQVTRPYWVDFSTTATGAVFLAGLCLFSTLGVGLLPSWQLTRTDVNRVLKDGGRSGGGTRSARRWTASLLVAQLAMTLILLTGAGLLVRSFFALYYENLIIDTRGLVTVRLALPADRYQTHDEQQRFIRALDERLSAMPQLSSVTIGSDIPIQPLAPPSLRSLEIDGQVVADRPSPMVAVEGIDDDYFATLRLPILKGRSLTTLDGEAGRESAVVNARFAEIYFPGREVLGHRIRVTTPGTPALVSPWLTIVGVATTVPNFAPNRMAEPLAYLPRSADQGASRLLSVIVRSSDAQDARMAAVQALREQAAAIDPDLPLYAIQTMTEAVALSRWGIRAVGSWFITIAFIALVLAVVGLYALTAHGVALRTQEIGVRMALGARSSQVVWLLIRRTVIQLALGLVLGLAGALAIGRLLSAFLRDTDPRDPVTLALVSTLLIAVALAASAWPARRAARIDPATALRAD